MPPIHILQRLFLLINVLLNHQERLEEFNHINEDAIREMDNMLTAMRRYDIREVFRQTMTGKRTKTNTRFPRRSNDF